VELMGWYCQYDHLKHTQIMYEIFIIFQQVKLTAGYLINQLIAEIIDKSLTIYRTTQLVTIHITDNCFEYKKLTELFLFP